MRNRILSGALVLGAFLMLPMTANGQRKQQKPDQKTPTSTAPAKSQVKFQPPSTTFGSVTVGGSKIDYKAVVGTIGLTDKMEKDTTAHMSYVAYFAKNPGDITKRPITFFYNGGPGSATVWLHMGSLGPKWVKTVGTEHLGGAPYTLESNPYSILDASDVVFIDMPGTGFGRVEEGHEKEYYGVDQDAAAFGQFIMRFITQYNRWNSPKYLFGESYGTLRSAVLSNLLHNTYSIDLNGVILLSQILNYDFSIDGPARNPGNDIPYVLGLPTYAATALYHNRLSQPHPDLKAFMAEVENFATGEYAHALSEGANLDDATFNSIAQKMHNYIGLPVDYIKKANLRISGGEFEHELLADENKITGRLDTRYSGPATNPLGQSSFDDPQSDAISSGYISLFNDYVRNVLKYGQKEYYRPSVYGMMSWDSSHRGSKVTNVMPDLASVMSANPKMKVMLNMGYYDLATPFFEGMYELSHLPMDRSLQKNISYAHYESGHMVYVNQPSLKELHDNVKAFIDSTH